jgi:hypothetical protein
VVLVGLNPNISRAESTELLLEHGISWCRHQARVFDQEREYDERSPFAFRAYQSLSAVAAHADGLSIPARASFSELRTTLHRTARLQAVKCIPRVEVSRPEREMSHRCPAFVLAEELKILQPRYILGVGARVRDAFGAMNGYRVERTDGKNLLTVGTVAVGRGSTTVFLIPHPSARGNKWKPGDAALRKHLRRAVTR